MGRPQDGIGGQLGEQPLRRAVIGRQAGPRQERVQRGGIDEVADEKAVAARIEQRRRAGRVAGVSFGVNPFRTYRGVP